MLLDTLGKPGDDTLLQAIRAVAPGAKVIVYSGYVRLMQEGALGQAADGYLEKGDDEGPLLDAIRAVVKPKHQLSGLERDVELRRVPDAVELDPLGVERAPVALRGGRPRQQAVLGAPQRRARGSATLAASSGQPCSRALAISGAASQARTRGAEVEEDVLRQLAGA